MTRRDAGRLFGDLGELLAHQEGGAADLDEYRAYAEDPLGFLRNVLGAEPWEAQREIARTVLSDPLVTVRSCHAAGKDWLAARLALWWVYGRGGLVVLTGPTATQVEEILMRGEIRAAFRGSGLPGDLHVRALRPGGEGQAGILAKTAVSTNALTGFHDARVLFVITEAQDPEIDHAWDAAFACATGAEDRILTLGNPTEPDGRFYRAHRPGSDWLSLKVAAEDVPNVREGETVVPGLLTRDGVERFRREYGEESGFYVSRVLAEFPSESADALVRREWLERARELHRDGALDGEARGAPLVLGVDPARLGPDRTCVCVRQGPVVQEFRSWTQLDTMETAGRILRLVRRLQRETAGVRTVAVDEVGLGGGVLDRLRETLRDLDHFEAEDGTEVVAGHRPSPQGFSAGKRAPQPERFANARAQSYWRVRKLLEEGRLALPPDADGLAEELLATRVEFRSDGRTAIESKDALKSRLGRSPDLADALAVSLAPDLEEERGSEILIGGKSMIGEVRDRWGSM